MKRRMTQGLSVVLSTAMVLSGSGIGTLSAAASVKEDSGVESNIKPAETAEKQEDSEDKDRKEDKDNKKDTDETGKENLEETEKEKNPEVTEKNEQNEAENDSEDAESKADTADEETEKDSSADVTEEETEESTEEETEESTEETEDSAKEETDSNVSDEENENTDNNSITEEESPQEESEEETKADKTEENASDEAEKEDAEKETPAESEKEKETAEEKPQEVVAKNISAKKARVTVAENIEEEATSADKFLEFLQNKEIAYTITENTELTDSMVKPSVNKIITISPGVALTIQNTTITSKSRLGFVSAKNNETTVQIMGNSSLQGGKFEIGSFNGSGNEITTNNSTVHIILEDNSSITAKSGFLVSSTSDITIKDSAKIIVDKDNYLTVFSQLKGNGSGTICLAEGAKVTVPDGIFMDQNLAFSSAEEVTVGAENAEPSTNQLSAGNYVWDDTNNCFAKATDISKPTPDGITAEQLKAQLEDTTTADISINEDITFNLNATTTAVKTINIAKDKTLTITKSETSGGTINGTKDLYFTGEGTIIVENEDGLQGMIRLGKVKDDAVVCYLKGTGSMSLSKLYAMQKTTLKMDSSSKIKNIDGKNITFNIALSNWEIENGATFILNSGDTFNKTSTGVNEKFSDRGKSFTLQDATAAVKVVESTAEPADNQLTAGTYTWNGEKFYKDVMPEPEKVTLEDLKNFLLSKTDTSLTLTNDLNLTEEITADKTNDKNLIIPEGVTLTISAPVTSTAKWLRFKGNGTLILNPASGSDGKSTDTLIGKIALGNDKAENPKVILKTGSSINTTINLSSNNIFLTMEEGSEIKCSNTTNLQFNNTVITNGAKITLTEGKSFTTNNPALFSDQGHSFTLTAETTIASAGATAADNQLTAGTYVWNGEKFYKEALSGITTEADLKTALEKTTVETILITKDITLSDTVVMGAKHTLYIADGVTLTITGCIDTKYKKADGNISAYQAVLDGNGTIKLAGTGDGLKGSFIVKNKQLTIEEGSSLLIEKGSLIIEKNSTLTVNSSLGIKAGRLQSIQIKDGGILTGTGKAGIQLLGESFVQGAGGKFSDQGKQLTTNERVDVQAADTAPADNQLTAGTYTWNGTCFFKPESSEPVPGSGITNEADLIAALQSDVTNLLVTESFKLQTNITLTSNHILEVAEGKTLTITGQLATGKARLTFVGKGKVLVRLKGNLNGRIYIGLENQKEPKGGYVVLSDEGRISSGNPYLANGGKLEINAPEGISLSKGNIFTIEPGGTLTGTGGIRLAEGAKITGAAGKFSDQGNSFSVNDEVVVAAANTVPADNQLSAGIYTWNGTCFFKPVPAPLPSTTLKDGILILSNKSVNHGSDEGWAWDAEKNVLNVNYRFKNIKQIQFAKSENASIKLNSDITLTPDEGMPAILAGGNLLFRADDPYTLTVTGTVRAEGKIEWINKITLNQSGTSEDALLWTEGDIMIKGNSKVIVNNQGTGAAIAGNAVTVKEEAELNVTGKGREPALKANGILGIGGPSAVVTAINRGKGPAISKDPNISDYPDAKISASESASGRPGVDYSAADVQKYRYIKVNKTIALSGNTTAAQVEKAVESLTADDYDAIDTVIEHIHALNETEKAALKPETLQKLDSLLQQATGIRPKLTLSDEVDTPHNQQIMKAEIFGALIAAGLNTNDSHSNTSLAFIVRQLETAPDAAATFTCSLVVNGNEIGLKLPVTLKIELPPEYFPLGADQMFLRGIRRPVMKLRSLDTASAENVVERWLDFVYDGKDNSATFQTDLLGTFSLVRKAGIGKPGSGTSSGSGGGSSSSGISRSNSPGTQNGGPGAAGGNWILDSVGWWYQYADQTYPSNGWFSLDYLGNKDWYYFNQNGYMLTGWVLSDGKWYYLNPVSDGSLGRMLTGWQQINGHWYYLNENSDGTRGAMLTDTWIEGNYVNPEGIWEEGKKK